MVGEVRFRADDPTSTGHDSALDLTSRVLSAARAGPRDPAPKMSLVVPIRVALLHRRSLDSKRARLFTTEAGAARGGRQAVAALALALARFVTSLASSAT
jgi:hypothetical protein